MNTIPLAQIDSYPVVPADALDEIAHMLLDPATTARAFQQIARELAEVRASRSTEEWRDYTRAFRDHPLLAILHQDAFTARGFRKPRGYAGDAVLIDMIYGSGEGEPILAKASALGQRIYHAAMTSTPIIAATRGRRDLLAAYIDQACQQHAHPHILSVACGHLREAALSEECKAGHVGRFVGLDQDRRSLRVIERSQRSVECVPASIGDLMDGSVKPGRFDLIYAAGLYDYLDDGTGRQLLEAMSRMIQPGGSILIANFMPNLSSIGYMEAAMDWWLVYRTAEQLRALANNLVGAKGSRVFADSFEQLAYLEVRF
jgi:chemotaxis methyl-accepting protein methylase